MTRKQIILGILLGAAAFAIYLALKPSAKPDLYNTVFGNRTGKCVPDTFTLTGWAWQWDDTGEKDYRIPCSSQFA